MQNYSIVMRGKPGSGSTSDKKAYAMAQYTEIVSFEDFCEHIASHGSVYSKGDYLAIITMMVGCLREMLLNGNRIQLGDLGVFSVALKSEGADTAADFSAANITAVKVRWSPGEKFRDLLDDMTFNLVTTREASAAVIKAVKAGDNTVTLTPSSGSEAA